MRGINLGGEKVWATVLKLIIPAMIAQFINVLYSIVDRMYVGNIHGTGDIALAAIGVCAPITTLISSFAFLIGTGGAPLLAMALGEGRKQDAEKILSNALFLLAVIAVIVCAVFCIFAGQILMVFGASNTTIGYAKQYLTIYAAGAIFSITSTGLNQYITAQGYSATGMITIVIGAVANIALDPLFIFVLKTGVAGAAYATIISQFLSFVFVITFLRLKNTKIRIAFRRPDFKLALRIIKLGISPFFIMASDSIIIIIQNSVLQSRGGADGDMWITVFTIVQAYFTLITMPLLGISTGSQPVLSFGYGAKNQTLIKKAEKRIVICCLAFTGAMTLLSLVIAKPFVSVFTSDPVITQKAVWGIKIFMIGVIPLSLQYAFVDGLTALGQPKYAITLSLARKVGVFLVCLIVFPMIWGVSGAFYAEPVADIVGATMSTCLFLAVFPKILKKRMNEEKPLQV